MDVSQIPSDADECTASDTAPNNGVGFMVGVAGDVAVVTEKGTTVVLPACQPGVQYALRVQKILSTNTTATGLVLLK
jgi:hypothetical protein